jgi:poly-gamma-glutamate synthase PgsB/CapB
MEALRLRRWRASVPLRISVTGTRGKTTLVRMLASVLREDGWRVLAKTTGSQPSLILPDGTEEEVGRKRIPTILEQIGLLRRGAELGVDVVVAEIMSIHAENHMSESRRILQPHRVLVTNFREDHTAAAGANRDEVASLHLLDVPPAATVFVPEGELLPVFREGVKLLGGKLEVVTPLNRSTDDPHPFPELLDLVRAVGANLGVSPEAVERGIRNFQGDIGEFWVRKYARGGEEALVANAFAANDPESTALALSRVRQGWVKGEGDAVEPSERTPILGILNLRRDRGDRTLQWLEALESGAMSEVEELHLVGFHGPAALRRLERGPWRGKARIIRERDPGRAMEAVLAGSTAPQSLVFGFGNLGGMGAELATHWLTSGPMAMEVVDGS